MSFRGINTTVIQIRRQVFTEVARMAYANVKGEAANHLMRKIPYTIIPGEEGKLRKDIFLERAIVERARPPGHGPAHSAAWTSTTASFPVSEDAAIADKYYDPPLVNVIKFACNALPREAWSRSPTCARAAWLTLAWRSAPRKPSPGSSGQIHHRPGEVHQVRPLRQASAPTTPSSRSSAPVPSCLRHGCHRLRRAAAARKSITTSASPAAMCLVNCPFGAIADKGQIYQLIQGHQPRRPQSIAIVAPAFVEPVRPGLAATGKLKAAMKPLGFHDVVEVAIGADLCTVEEAHDFMEEVPGKQPFMATSCCPAWSVMAKTAVPRTLRQIYLHDHDPHGAARPACMKQADPEAARLPSSDPAPPRSWKPAAAPSAATWTSC